MCVWQGVSCMLKMSLCGVIIGDSWEWIFNIMVLELQSFDMV